MAESRRLLHGGLLFALLAMPACRESELSATQASTVPPADVATLSSDPQLDIGQTDGPPEYLLHNAVSSLRLSDGGVVVLNAGSHQLRFFDASGRHVRSVGTKGNGPGEFRRPVKIYAAGGDSIVVLDVGTLQETRFDGQGILARTAAYTTAEGETFPRESWLYGRAYIDGPTDLAERDLVRRILDVLPPLAGTRAYRRVIVDAHARLWVRQAPTEPKADLEWDVYGLDGSPLTRVATPAGFELQQIGEDFLLGRARDSLNVEHIRLYGLRGMPLSVPATVSAAASPAVPNRVPSEATLVQMRSVLRNLMAQQEMFYSKRENGFRYADRTDQLEWPEDMHGLVVHLVDGGPTGWTALLFHETEPISCGVTVGISGPVGWQPGVVLC